MTRSKMEAVGTVSRRDLEPLAQSFARLWPVDGTPCFHDLLRAVDEADQRLRRTGDDGRHPDSRRGATI